MTPIKTFPGVKSRYFFIKEILVLTIMQTISGHADEETFLQDPDVNFT